MPRRPRVTCPVCDRRVALTAKTRVIGRHHDGGTMCAGVGRITEYEARMAELAQLAVLVYAYPDRARALVAQLPAQAPMVGLFSLN